MRSFFYAKALFVATMLFGNSTVAHSSEILDPESYEGAAKKDKAAAETGGENRATLEFAAVDFCYAGSVVDPATGESIDLYVHCPEDGFEQNINIG